MRVKIDGKTWKIKNDNPRSFDAVEVWAANAQHGFPPPADAYIKDLEYEDENTGITTGPR